MGGRLAEVVGLHQALVVVVGSDAGTVDDA
jgi:hypothetical protein